MALTGLILFLPGIPVTLIGLATVAATSYLHQYTTTDPQYDSLKTALTIIPFAFLIGGILMLVSGIGVWAHKQWARFIGILISLLVFLACLALGLWLNGQHGIARFTNTDGNTVTLTLPGLEGVAVPLIIWGFAIVVLVLGGSYFRKVRVN